MARHVGTDGKLGGQADVRGVAGSWKDLTKNVTLAANLTGQACNSADVIRGRSGNVLGANACSGHLQDQPPLL